MTRFVPVTVLVVLTASRVASADMGTLPNSATLAFDQLYIHENGLGFKEPSDPDARRYYFNLAHCVCSKANAGKETTFQYLLKLDIALGKTIPAELWVGTTCESAASRTGSPAMCRQLTDPQLSDISAVMAAETRLEFSIYDVIAGVNNGKDCPQDEGVVKPIFLLADTDGVDGIDYSLVKNVGQPPGDTAAGVDTKPPPLPTGFSASPSDGGIEVSWSVPTSRATDLYFYQALCATSEGTPVRTDPQKPRYVTSATLCFIADTPLTASSIATGPNDTAITALPDGLKTLDPAFICGEQATGTANRLSIDGLENGMPYTVALVATDLYGNYVGTYFTSTITPQPATDFWEDLHDRGGIADGGFCLLAETYGDNSSLTTTLRAFRDDTLGSSWSGRWLTGLYYATLGKLGAYVHGTVVLRVVAAVMLAPVVAVALLWHWLTLPGLLALIAAAWWWRRRRARLGRTAPPLLPRRWVKLATGMMIAFGASHAHAGGYQPYWENSNIASEDQSAAADDPGLVEWHAGIRIGPYLPDVDKKLGLTPGPFDQMFGASRPMPMLDVDRILWTGFGQVGIGISGGYMQWFAHPFINGSKADDAPPRMRSRGDTNRFRLIPLALTAIYRLTWLDDEYGIPVVPYIRGGLSYYIWWLDAKNDHVCKDITSTAPMCDLNKPHGASLGAQGSIGLAIRAERIDASTAMSMHQSGIQHAGIYGELSLARVDGFGSDTKLSVGDRTWFAGVDFEF